ncbi:MAG: hypothetical protein NWT08_02860 [Akkermansiaceae bacterium]|nr:hypothetical protein [Akkermansiaceae bacterium]MDP4646856.1 hypothetical protein [Akkermansiaceae bacterium]MDP4721420.1 hypothetical protein [Akkermansiaceae bacterium]MDP4845780.1 hypothetical protein [Akkermansiaceae bacterium]MDP4896347.1 hypothetical protein [Akkermansiaceae bacterium]
MKAAGWFVLAALLIVAALLSTRRVKPVSVAPVVRVEKLPEVPPPQNPLPSSITILPVAEIAATLNSPETTVQDDLSTLDFLLSQYRKFSGGNPVGANDEITAALLGRNSKGVAFINSDGAPLDSEGQLLDRWGTPYFFHAISGEQMEIISAGPDLRHYTSDDIKAD